MPELSDPLATLEPNRRKARYGVAYLRSVCAQAGVGMTETSPDEDVLAVDCSIEFFEAPVRVQVKCTSQFAITGRSASWSLDPAWTQVWAKAKVPVYFVLVIVGKDYDSWLEHDVDGTVHRAAAFWRRLVPGELGTRLEIPKSQRLSAETLQHWRRDMLAQFTGPGGE
jgi:hypothetical protein